MRTKWLCLLAVVCLLVSIFGMTPVLTSAATPQVVVSNGTISANDASVYEVKVSLVDNPGVTMMRLKLNYDTENLKLIGVTDAGVLGNAIHTSSYNASPYYLYWSNAVSTTNFTANGVIATLRFELIGATDNYEISVSANYGDILDKNEDEVAFSMTAGTISACSHDNASYDTIVEVGCEVDGKSDMSCPDCGVEMVVTTPATGHKYSDWTVVEATTKRDGYKTRTCSYCGDVETVVLPKLTLDTPYVELSDVTVNNRYVQVAVKLFNNPGVSSLKLMLDYDTDYMTLIDVSNANAFSSLTTNGNELHWTNGGANVTADTTIANLTFELNETAPLGVQTNVSVSVVAGDTYNAAGQAVSFTTVNSEITLPDTLRYTVTVVDTEGGTVAPLPSTAYYGDVLTVSITLDEGYTLAYWLINDRYYHAKKTFDLPVNNDLVITPVLRSPGEESDVYTLRFFTADGVLETTMLSTDITNERDLPEIPIRYGYTITGWDIALEDGIDSDKDVFPCYEKVSDTYTVGVIGGTANVANPQFEDKVIVTANDPDNFAAWVDENGNVMSVAAEYKFFATQDIVLIAKSKSDLTVPDYFISVNKTTQNVSTSDSKYRFYVVANTYYDQDLYTMVERGIIYTQADPVDKDDFVIGATGVKKKISSATGNGQFMYRLNNAPKGSVITVRAYMVLKDADGNFVTVYSDLCNASWIEEDDDHIHEDDGDF